MANQGEGNGENLLELRNVTKVFGGLTALFYAGNVYGANVAARDYNVLQKRRYLGRAESLLGRLRLEPDYRHLRDSLNPDVPAAAAEE